MTTSRIEDGPRSVFAIHQEQLATKTTTTIKTSIHKILMFSTVRKSMISFQNLKESSMNCCRL